MAVAEMLKVRLVIHKSAVSEVISTLQNSGLMEVERLAGDNIESETHEHLDILPLPDNINILTRLVSEMNYIVDFLSPYAVRREGLLDRLSPSRLPISRKQFEAVAHNYRRYEHIYDDLFVMENRMIEIRNEKARLEHDIEELEPWRELDIPLGDAASTGRAMLLMASMDEKRLPDLIAELKKHREPFHIEKISAFAGRLYFLFVAISTDTEALTIIHKYDPVLWDFPPGTPPASIRLDQLREELNHLEQEMSEIEKQAVVIAADIDTYKAACDYLRLELERYTVLEKVAGTESVTVIDGWARARDADELNRRVHTVTPLAEVTFRNPLPGEDVPVSLVNSRLTRPFEIITRLYSLPSFRELDPTSSLAIFFFIFFGMALGDAGYGTVMALLSLAGLRFLRLSDSGRNFLQLLLICAVSTIIYGAYSKAWFGNLIFPDYDFVGGFITVMIVSLALGVVHLIYAIMVELYDNARHGDRAAAILDQGSWLLFIAGTLLFSLSRALSLPAAVGVAGNYLFAFGALASIYSMGRMQKNIPARLAVGLGTFYMSVTGFLGDVLSYLRLLALGLATGGIAVVVNQIARLFRDIPYVGLLLMILIMAVGHIMNMAINIFGAFIHSTRLQFVEFFGKFYEGGGREFRPFAAGTKYIEIIDKEGAG
jgi:V/A-type H+-transporting ATPase subunit I